MKSLKNEYPKREIQQCKKGKESMRSKFIMISMLTAFLTSHAQQIHIPSYFPVQDNGRWIYINEFGNLDTATMKVNISFLQEKNIEIFFSQNERQYFRADISGLRMLGQTIPLGTFMFDSPLGISSMNANIGDGVSTYNWEVTHVPSGIHKSWGTAQASLDRVETNYTVLDSTYDSVLVISVLFGHGYAQYFLAKGRGIVKSIATGSPSYSSRALIKYLPAETTNNSNMKIWKTQSSSHEIKVISAGSVEVSRLFFSANSNNIQINLFNCRGQLICEKRIANNSTLEIRLQEKLKSGRYILQLNDGKMAQNRSFSILR